MQVEELARELADITRAEPLALRRSRRALKAAREFRPAAGIAGTWAAAVSEAGEALDRVTAARRNEEGLDGYDLHWEREKAIEGAYNDLEALAELAEHAAGRHLAADRAVNARYCRAC